VFFSEHSKFWLSQYRCKGEQRSNMIPVKPYSNELYFRPLLISAFRVNFGLRLSEPPPHAAHYFD